MKIYEILDRDPRTTRLANNGQARILNQIDEHATAELRAELETFVCEGRFSDAIERVIGRYLPDLGNPRQSSVWVSGFFGSGKSHLLKMLTHLWMNTTFDGGSNARNIVSEGLPDEIQAHLRELDTQANRIGKRPFAAAGTMLGGTDQVRATVLSIILQAGGWPSQYPLADFCFWLREQGWLDAVRSAVEESGRDWLHELNNLYVSPHIARALLQVDKDFAPDERSARQVLLGRFPQLSTDITTQQFVEAARKALGCESDLPLTLIVLDEVQQYIGESVDRASIIIELAEALQTQFDSRVMLVCAGQSALEAGTPNLQKLLDRFSVRVQLTDQDVEAVTRKVLLRKKAQAMPEIESLLEDNAGEIARHLQGTRLGQRAEDQSIRAIDYPLLPTRRRFWEACFQAVDVAGTHSQLRSQLRILYDSLNGIAERDLGGVIPASDIFNELAPSLVNTGVLLNEINSRIQSLDDGTEIGRLRRDLCGLAFLIGKLPREQGVDLGVRADATTLADLLINNITLDSGPFRNNVKELLEELASNGTLMKVGDEYRLQTTQGAEWEGLYREKQASLRQNEVEISNRRDQIFGQHFQKIMNEVKLLHGESKLPRTVSLHTGGESPRSGGDRVVVWMRDGWSCSEANVIHEARQGGQDDPTIYIHLPRNSDSELMANIISGEAARQVLEQFGAPTSLEGREARDSMESRRKTAEEVRNQIVNDLIRTSKVLQGGGTEVYGEELINKIQNAMDASLIRLFPRFEQGDHRYWETALNRAKDGSDEPFKIVGWDKPTEEHPVAKEVLAKVGTSSLGSSLQSTLKAPDYGWPQDAIDAAIIALHRTNHLRATRNGQPVAQGDLNQAGIKTTEFRPENIRLTAVDRIALRGIFQKVEVSTKSGEEEVRAPYFLESMIEIARKAGGVAPLPPEPDTTLVTDLRQRAGIEQLSAILESKDELEEMIRDWTTRAERGSVRSGMWQIAEAFRYHAEGLPILDEVGAELDSIIEQRSLLAEMDQATPLVAKLAEALRETLTKRHEGLTETIGQAKAQLSNDPIWKKLDQTAQTDISHSVGLTAPRGLDIANNQQLQVALADRSLSAWQAEIDAASTRRANALEKAAVYLKGDVKTTTVSVRRGTLSNEAEVEEWLVEHAEILKEAVAKGAVIVK